MKRQLLVVAAMLCMVAVGCFQASAVPAPPMGPPEVPGGEEPGRGPERDVALLIVALDPSDAQREEFLNPAQQAKAEQILRLTAPPPHGPGKPF
ncbi:hypothetical protein [Trichloromonas sp.]|uniref:hypothetical protein n=1 Tax=Trichloromonas sp. TaxID=3069249 RepID=UPI002A49F331|nr:hypothetical protein [Trichloromonas sp.]